MVTKESVATSLKQATAGDKRVGITLWILESNIAKLNALSAEIGFSRSRFVDQLIADIFYASPAVAPQAQKKTLGVLFDENIEVETVERVFNFEDM